MKPKKSQNDGKVPINKKNLKLISDYINTNKPKSKKTAYLIENGKSVEKTAYTLPRQLLRLNPANHRFTTSVHELIDERIDNNKPPNFDMGKKFDVEQIRNMLRGVHPTNPDRKTNYDNLFFKNRLKY